MILLRERVCQSGSSRNEMEKHFVFCHFLSCISSGKETRVVQEKYSFLNDDAFIVLVSGECLIAQILQKK